MGLGTEAHSPQTAGPFATGMVLLGVGGFFLAERFGLASFEPERLWPLILVAVGFSILLSALFSRTAAKVLPGMINLLLGGFFLLFTAGPLDYEQMATLWPVFPLVVGISFGFAFLASLGRKPGLLVPGFVCFSVGTIGLAFTLTPLGSLFSMLGWPMILLSIGALFVLVGLGSFLARSLAGLARV